MLTQPAYLGYLGPEGTFSEEAAQRYVTEARLPLTLRGLATCREIVAGVTAGTLAAGVLPWENSLEGPVTPTLDLLFQAEGCTISAEVVIPVVHSLLVRLGTPWDEVEEVHSHPQALGQCRRFLETYLPGAAQVPAASTAAAARAVAAGDRPWAAIGPAWAAARYGLQPARIGIQDEPGNWTRFVILAGRSSKWPGLPAGPAKTAVVLLPPAYRAAALPTCLGILAEHGVPLLKLESRPARRRLGEYVYLLEVAGHAESPSLAQALAELRRRAGLRILGSYAACCHPDAVPASLGPEGRALTGGRAVC